MLAGVRELFGERCCGDLGGRVVELRVGVKAPVVRSLQERGDEFASPAVGTRGCKTRLGLERRCEEVRYGMIIEPDAATTGSVFSSCPRRRPQASTTSALGWQQDVDRHPVACAGRVVRSELGSEFPPRSSRFRSSLGSITAPVKQKKPAGSVLAGRIGEGRG